MKTLKERAFNKLEKGKIVVNTSLKYNDGTPNFFPLRSRVKDDKVQGILTKIVRGKILYKSRSLELNAFDGKIQIVNF